MRKTILLNRVLQNSLFQNVAAYLIAGTIVWYLARGISMAQLAESVGHANLWIFIPASMGSFLCWFLGETFLFSRLFTYFHRRTRFGEMIPANAAQYFLQVINMAVAGGALVLFLHQRKKVPWLAGGVTLMFQGFIDWFVLAVMIVAAAMIVPTSRIWNALPYAAGSLVFWVGIAWFWMEGKPRERIGRWIYARPSFVSFRAARPEHYLKLIAIRSPIFAVQGFTLYAELLSFHIHVPLIQVLAFTPAVLLMGGLPLTPVGMGPLQAVLMGGFSAFAGKAPLLTMSLAISMMNIMLRLPLGLGSAGAFAHEVSVSRKKAAGGEPAVIAELAHEALEAVSEPESAAGGH